MTPLGIPVVPPVYCRAAVSCLGLISILGGVGGDLSTSSLKCWMPVSLGILWLGTFPSSEPMMRFVEGRYSPMLAVIRFLSFV